MMRTVLLVSACVAIATAASGQTSRHTSEEMARGRLLTQRYCAGCHAIGREGASPRADAPPFRDLHDRYPVNSLAEALAEGILVGHPAMPQMRFPPKDVSAILAYLNSIQTDVRAGLDRAEPKPAP